MARRELNAPAGGRGWSDVLGILLLSLALLLLAALFSFDKHDLPFVREPANHPKHNLIGYAGALAAYGLFFTFGAAAFLLPVLFIGYGLGCFFELFQYLRRRWVWTLILLGTCMGALDLYPNVAFLAELKRNLNAPSAGGLLGHLLNRYLFSYFGLAGATILFATFWLLSLYGLSNFQLGEWLRALKPRPAPVPDPFTADDRQLERRAKELEKEARRLQDQIDKAARKEEAKEAREARELKEPPKADKPGKPEPTGLGPDLKPVPEPTVRDLSVPQFKPGADQPREKPPEVARVVQPPEEPVEVITSREIAAATVAQVLGRPPAPKPGAEAAQPAAGSSPVAAPAGEATAAAASAAPAEVPPPAGTPAAGSAPAPTAVAAAATRTRPAPRKPKPIAVAATPIIGNYQMPPMELLSTPDLTVRPTESKEELMANARLMQQTLAQFDIEVALGDITKGPTITRYELHPAPGVKLERITGLTNNIAAALKAERIHILAPVPGKSSVGVEVPNLIKSKVILRELLESDEWRAHKARIPLALGKDVYGHPIIADLSEMPHLLIAGSTGSGKSVCINAIIASLLYRFPPDQLRFVMIDPKVVELQHYNTLPHLVVPVVTDPKKVILALRWVVNEMEKRYQIFARVGVRNIKSFNDRPKHKPPPPPPQPELLLTARKEKVEPGADGFAVEVDEEIVVPRDEDIVIPDKLSYIVVIIDELADLMLVAPADVEMAIARITQMARAAGIHCIVATQRPSVDVITGVIKANIPARIAFQVAAKVDSRTILDAMGADKLLGKGDMLYLPPGSARLIRAQGALITDQENQAIVDFIARQGKPSYEVDIHQQLSQPGGGLNDEDGGIDEDEGLIDQCVEVIRSEQKASVSLLQRRLRLGYTRAARIMDELENRGIVGPSKGAEPRDILIDLDGEGGDGGRPQSV